MILEGLHHGIVTQCPWVEHQAGRSIWEKRASRSFLGSQGSKQREGPGDYSLNDASPGTKVFPLGPIS